MNIINNMWVEKYRPSKLEDMVLPDDYMFDFKRYIYKDREIPHLIMYGSPGGGKSALARIICSKNGIIENREDNLLEINGSAKETRGISFVQDVIEPFLKVPPAGNDKIKIVFIDESDYLTDASFHSLRGIIEKYSKQSRFLFTCNYFSKIPEALQSRLRSYKFRQLPIDFVVNYCNQILTKENIIYDIKDIRFMIEYLYPDIRKIIDTLQKCSLTGTLKVSKDDVVTIEKSIIASIVEICKYIESKNSRKVSETMSLIVKLVNSNELEFRNLYLQLFSMNEIIPPLKIVVNKYCNSHKDCLIPPMHFLSMIFEMIFTLKKYYETIGK